MRKGKQWGIMPKSHTLNSFSFHSSLNHYCECNTQSVCVSNWRYLMIRVLSLYFVTQAGFCCLLFIYLFILKHNATFLPGNPTPGDIFHVSLTTNMTTFFYGQTDLSNTKYNDFIIFLLKGKQQSKHICSQWPCPVSHTVYCLLWNHYKRIVYLRFN